MESLTRSSAGVGCLSSSSVQTAATGGYAANGSFRAQRKFTETRSVFSRALHFRKAPAQGLDHRFAWRGVFSLGAETRRNRAPFEPRNMEPADAIRSRRIA